MIYNVDEDEDKILLLGAHVGRGDGD